MKRVWVVVVLFALAWVAVTSFEQPKPIPLSLADHQMIIEATEEAANTSGPPAISVDGYVPLMPEDVPSLPPRLSGCSEDCSGHEAGYEWAEEHDIRDPGDCDGNSQSFVEGCEERAEDWQLSNPEEQPEEF
jgi:hypothetical protein